MQTKEDEILPPTQYFGLFYTLYVYPGIHLIFITSRTKQSINFLSQFSLYNPESGQSTRLTILPFHIMALSKFLYYTGHCDKASLCKKHINFKFTSMTLGLEYTFQRRSTWSNDHNPARLMRHPLTHFWLPSWREKMNG